MLHHSRRDESGFTLIELLVVILIVGVLAAIALPVFLGQQNKAHDADAKANAKSLTTLVEACYTGTQDYTACSTASGSDLGPTGLPTGSGRGQVDVGSLTASSFVVTARSKSGTNFVVTRTASTGLTRSCTVNAGGCKGGTW